MRVILIVIDGFGIGAMPDAYKWGDSGSNTFVNIFHKCAPILPTLTRLGLKNIDGVNINHYEKIIGNYARLSEKTNAKDSIAGHYEMMGIVMENPYPVFPKGFPFDLVNKLEETCGIEFLGNEVASGTEIVQRLGQQSIRERKAILYTSADSVLQIACHDSVRSKNELYSICEKARAILIEPYHIGRVIARPFATVNGKFLRTPYRKDYAIYPDTESVMEKLQKNNIEVTTIGKIGNLFAGKGIDHSIDSNDNGEAFVNLRSLIEKGTDGFIFVNLNDTDCTFGHRNDVQGYSCELERIDKELSAIIKTLALNDVLIITADHGNDPTTSSTNHSREYVPMLVYGKSIATAKNLGTFKGFDTIGNLILSIYGINNGDTSEDKIYKNLFLF